MQTVRIRNWDKWQSYRRDRGQPPWIKIQRALIRDPQWVALSDAQRGQLVAIWVLAADRDGVIPASPSLLQKLCYMDSEPDINLFMDHGFIERDATVTPIRRQHDCLEAEAEAETKADSLPSVGNARGRATRLPEDFELTDVRRLVAEAEKLPAERTFAKFRDYWLAASGAKARKHDWDATWRNWCRTEADRSRGSNGTVVPRKTKYEEMMERMQADIAEAEK